MIIKRSEARNISSAEFEKCLDRCNAAKQIAACYKRCQPIIAELSDNCAVKIHKAFCKLGEFEQAKEIRDKIRSKDTNALFQIESDYLFYRIVCYGKELKEIPYSKSDAFRFKLHLLGLIGETSQAGKLLLTLRAFLTLHILRNKVA